LAGFLYYVPGERTFNHETLAKAGIGYAFGDAGEPRATVRGVGTGPDGAGGLILARNDVGIDPATVGYYPEAQTWQVAAGGKHWIGIAVGQAPGPGDLEADEMLAGHFVRLGDGNDWLIPVARHFATGGSPPSAITLGPNGELVMEPLQRYVQFSSHGDRVWEDQQVKLGWIEAAEDRAELTIAEGWEIAIEALALNYRVSPTEVAMLRLLTTPNMPRILEALTDWPAIKAVAKATLQAESRKNGADTPDGSSTSDAGPSSTCLLQRDRQ